MNDFSSKAGHPYAGSTTSLHRRGYVDVIFGQVHYHVCGNRDPNQHPLLLLHMSPKNGRQWRQVMAALSHAFYTLAPDYPGYGESDPPPAEPAVSIEDYARSMWALVDAIGLAKVDLAGIHTGSMVAIEMARQRPGQVHKIIQFSAPIFTPEELIELRQHYQNPLPLDEAGSRFSIMWQRIMQYRGPQADQAWAAWSMRDNLMAGEAYEWGHRAAFNYAEQYNHYLLEIEHPMMVVNPHDDCYTATTRFRELTAADGYRYEEKPQWQGSGFLDYNAVDVAQLIKSFLR
ncbi:MAG: pimeloyl-ACP methyl ester carboxylesterase [Oceanicoccus sp.]|jgi:pimeloyl-ACP methyl ester carboxylesterase